MAPVKRTTSPAFQFYPKDFLASRKVDRMSMTERGIYITLLARCWDEDGLPTDLGELATMARMKRSQFERLWNGSAVRLCFTERGGKLYNERLDRERKVQVEFRRKQKEKADKRWESRGNAMAMPRSEPGNAPLPQSSSAIRNPQSADRIERPAPIVGKRNLHAAWEGPRVYITHTQHKTFIGLRNHPGAEAELFAWYATVSDEWTTGAKAAVSPGADMFAFWTARFNERWPTTPTVTAKATPAWVVKR